MEGTSIWIYESSLSSVLIDIDGRVANQLEQKEGKKRGNEMSTEWLTRRQSKEKREHHKVHKRID
jgi:hypothetical protein